MNREKLLDTYLELFVHRRDVHARQRPTGAYFLQRSPVTSELIRAHLKGELTAGFYALTSDNTTRWVVLDADGDDGLERLQQAWRELEARGISSQLETSRRGGHLWVFCEPLPARLARQLISRAASRLEGVELFPKRDVLTRESPLGSLVRGPLGVHRRSDRRYPFVDPISLKPVSATVLGTLEYLGSLPRLSLEHADRLLSELSAPSAPLPESPIGPTTRPGLEGRRSPIEELKRHIGDPYAFIARYVELDASGRGHCPFHPPDIHPSFAVNRRQGYWTDFHETNPRTGHYTGGDVIEFYRRLRNVSYGEAVKALQTEHSSGTK